MRCLQWSCLVVSSWTWFWHLSSATVFGIRLTAHSDFITVIWISAFLFRFTGNVVLLKSPEIVIWVTWIYNCSGLHCKTGYRYGLMKWLRRPASSLLRPRYLWHWGWGANSNTHPRNPEIDFDFFRLSMNDVFKAIATESNKKLLKIVWNVGQKSQFCIS